MPVIISNTNEYKSVVQVAAKQVAISEALLAIDAQRKDTDE